MMAKLKALEMRLRARAPEPVRQAFRLANAMRTSGEPLPQVPDELIDGCRMCSSRYRMLELLPKRGRVVELGTYKGDFARRILETCEPQELHVVDIDYSQFDTSLLRSASVVKHEGLTHEVMATFADASVDWVYVDGDHSEAGVTRDAEAAAAKIKPGGLMIFNDFAHIDPRLGRYGIHRAVIRFVTRRRWPMVLFAYEGDGLYDVALQRPQTVR